jgi:hypothetical protein
VAELVLRARDWDDPAEARAAFVHDRTSESREAWRVALVDQQEAHSYCWAVAWEFVELLHP